MSKIAFVFPGQGAQYTGMAKDFYEKYAVSREVFESASKASGLDVKALCFEENDRLNITEYTQIAMLTAEIAILRAVEEAGIRSQEGRGCIYCSAKKRNFYAGGISYRWCNVRCSWNRCRAD